MKIKKIYYSYPIFVWLGLFGSYFLRSRFNKRCLFYVWSLTFHKSPRSHLQCPVSCVLRSMYNKNSKSWILCPTFRILGLGYRVPLMSWLSGFGSWVSPLGSQVPRLTHEIGPGFWVLGPTKSPGSRFPFFGHAKSFSQKMLR